MAEKIRFDLQGLETAAEGVLDVRGRKGEAAVPVQFASVRLRVKIKTTESDERVKRLIELAEKYCPVQSLIRAAVPDFVVT
jgi:organic hydroperoxide reductase OsmC/OhrA